MANGQIAWLGWREGMSAEAASELVHEGLHWARETDDLMIPVLLFVDGPDHRRKRRIGGHLR